MKVSDFLSPHDVTIDLRASDKSVFLRQLAAEAALKAGLGADQIASEILKREALGSTGVGRGVALPHARLLDLEAPLGVFARLATPIEFDAIDGRQVDIVFLLLLPQGDGGAQGSALACAARALRDERKIETIRAADRDAIYDLIKD